MSFILKSTRNVDANALNRSQLTSFVNRQTRCEFRAESSSFEIFMGRISFWNVLVDEIVLQAMI